MSTSVTALAEWIRTFRTQSATADVDSEPATDAEPAVDDEPASSLFECAECQSVYVAAEKTSCRGCGAPVERVASTLSVSE